MVIFNPIYFKNAIQRSSNIGIRNIMVNANTKLYRIQAITPLQATSHLRYFAASPKSAPIPTVKESLELADLHEHHRTRTQEHVKDIIGGKMPNLEKVKHPHATKDLPPVNHAMPAVVSTQNYIMPHAIWQEVETKNVEIFHIKPRKLPDYLAYLSVQMLRFTWDTTTGYLWCKKLGLGTFSYRSWLLRICYLETVAGVPGMMFGMVRHLNSLRRMERDHGWIHTLLAEAENERMHLLTFLKLYEPGTAFRYAVVTAQFIVSNYLFLCYLISPRYGHKFVGYLEEEAVKTYTNLLNDIDAGLLPELLKPCDPIAADYWQLPPNSTWKDVMLQVRADEAHHRDVNHTLAPLSVKQGAPNPFRDLV